MPLNIPDIKKIDVDLKSGITITIKRYPEITTDILRVLCNNAGILRNWMWIMRSLGLDEADIYATEYDYKNYGIKEIVFKAFEKWKNSREKATMFELHSALRKCEINNIKFDDLSTEESDQTSLSGIERAVEFPCSQDDGRPHKIGFPSSFGNQNCCKECMIQANESQIFKFWVKTEIQQND